MARRYFAEVGYPKSTMRAIAREAGVDPRMITHFFGSKQRLFVETFEFPFVPEELFAQAFATPGEGTVGQALSRVLAGILGDRETRNTILGLLRAAASEAEAAELIKELISQRVLTNLARHIRADHPELRATLIGSTLVGTLFARHVVGLEPLAEADPDVIAGAIAGVLDHYLTVPL